MKGKKAKRPIRRPRTMHMKDIETRDLDAEVRAFPAEKGQMAHACISTSQGVGGEIVFGVTEARRLRHWLDGYIAWSLKHGVRR